MKKFRVIYKVDAISKTCYLIERRYARNLKTARKIFKQLHAKYEAYVEITKCNDYDRSFIRDEWVEG